MSRSLGVWDTGEGSLHAALAGAIKCRILDGTFRHGDILPSHRELTQVMAVSRTTVASAYAALRDEGLVSSRRGGTTWVSAVFNPRLGNQTGDRLATYAGERSPLDLTSGALPTNPVLARVVRTAGARTLARALTMESFLPAGWPALRERLADMFTAAGLATRTEEVVVTNGSHHALSLVAAHALGERETVLVEDPTYRGALDLFTRLGAHIIPVPTDEEGIIADELAAAAQRLSPRMLYVMPKAHNVTGVSWSCDRRRRVAEIANRHHIFTVEDASTADLHDGPPLDYLAADLDPDLAVVIGSVTKLFWTGLRVGWVRGPGGLLTSVVRARLANDLGGSLPSHVLTAECLGVLGEARAWRIDELRRVRELALGLVGDQLPQWQPGRNDGGACLWIDTRSDAVELTHRLREVGVLILPGPTFSAAGRFPGHIRLPLGRPEVLEHAVEILRRASIDLPSPAAIH